MKRATLAMLAAALLLGTVSCQRHAPAMPDLNSVSSLQQYLGDEPEAEGTEEDGRDLLQAWLFQLQQRAFPGDRADWPAWTRAAAARDALAPAMQGDARWTFVGPVDLPVPYRTYFGQGAINGRVNAVAFDPTRSDTLYLGSAGGGLWKSTDRGHTWAPLTDGWPFLHVSSLAVAPNGRDVYAGTGDFAYPIQRPSLGLMHSPDAGATWAPCGPSVLRDYAISRVLLNPDNPQVILLSTGRGRNVWGGVWQSRDGGGTWTQILREPAAWCDVACSAKDAEGRRIWYAVGYTGPGARLVYRSRTGGRTWEPVLTLGPQVNPGLAAIATSPVDPQRAYAVFGGLHQVWTTADGGQTWTDATGNMPAGYNWSQDWYDLSLAISNTGAQDLIYTGLIDVLQGIQPRQWRSIGRTYTSEALTHNDQQALAVDPRDPDHLLVGSDGGAYDFRFSPGRDAWTWKSLNERLGVTQFYHAAFHPTDPNVLLAGTQDNSTPACQGDPSRWINVGGGDGGFCAINPQRPATQYASSQFLFLYRTDDAWKTTRMITPAFGSDRRAFIAPIALDPQNPDLLYAGTNHLWRYDAGKSEWTPRLGGQKLSQSGVVQCLAVDGPRIVTGSNFGEVWMTFDGGSHWQSLSEGLPRRVVTSILLQEGHMTVTLSGTGSGHVWQCDTPEKPAWRDISGNLPDTPANALAVDGGTLYVGTDVGVFCSENGGETWENATRPLGLPNVQVNDLQFVPGTGYLNAATFGRGLWRLKLHAPDRTP